MIHWALPDALWYRHLPVTSFFKRMIFWPSGHWYDEVSVYKVAWTQRSLARTETCRHEPSLSCMSTTVDNFIIKKTFPFLEGKDSAWAWGGFIRTGTLLNCLFQERYCDFRNNYLIWTIDILRMQWRYWHILKRGVIFFIHRMIGCYDINSVEQFWAKTECYPTIYLHEWIMILSGKSGKPFSLVLHWCGVPCTSRSNTVLSSIVVC
jgi:hypothetical protein